MAPPDCACVETHPRRRVVLTGGPGAGKTAVLELVRRHFCHHVVVLPESASLLFSGGFPRNPQTGAQRAAQRAIFYVQRELERLYEAQPEPAIALCDRGTLDGLAYWPGEPEEFLAQVGTTKAEQLARYHTVLHLRTPLTGSGYDRLSNPLRIETAAEAEIIDARIAAAWDGHPHRIEIASTPDFIDKALAAIEILREELPPCCRGHHVPSLVRPMPPVA